MNLILMIDISGSMTGHKIGAVNDAMENLIDALKNYAASSESVSLSVMLFSKNVSWMGDSDVAVETFEWIEPECTGMTSLGKACLVLSDKLKSEDKTYDILVLSDGCPTDDYNEGIEALDSLASFQNSRRFAIAIGDDADIPSLVRFTGDVQKVYKVSDLNDLISAMTSALQIDYSQQTDPISPIANSEGDEWD